MTAGKHINNKIPNYRNIHKAKNSLDAPTKDWKCEYCHKPLTDKNRSVISTRVICIQYAIYQLCAACRERFFGNCDDALMLKYAYIIAEDIRRKQNEKTY